MKNDFSGFKRACAVFLVITLIFGVLASSFGITVMAMTKKPAAPAGDDGTADETTPQQQYKAPTEDYSHLSNEVAFNEDVVVLSQEDSQQITSSIINIETGYSNSYQEYITVTLDGEEFAGLSELSKNDIFYLEADNSSPLGSERILRVNSISEKDGYTYLNASEPYFEEVFDSLEICASDALSQENFVGAYYAEGVSSYFGDIDVAIPEAEPMSHTDGAPQVQNLGAVHATENKSKNGDLIVEIDYDFTENKKEDDDDKAVDGSFGIKGQFGIRDLTSHLVCEMPTAGKFEELYLGLSGETFLDVDIYGSITAEAQMEASKKDWKLLSLEGLSEKRFPIAVFEFKGTTPVHITNAAFNNRKESVIPSLFVMIYADWEGKISLELSGGFEMTDSFNSGLHVFKEGELLLHYGNYPYTAAYDVESQDGFSWEADLTLEADTDLTLLGASALFYIAGVNVGELSVARLGIEAQCNLSLSANSKEGVKLLDEDDTEFYIRGYLRMLEIKVKLKAEGKSFLKGLEVDVNFEFTLLDLTLFEAGIKPKKFKPEVPISTIKPPTEFESVITLVCDVSGSMDSRIDTGDTKLQAAREAAKVIVTTTEDWADSSTGNFGIGLVQFSDSAETVAVPHIDYKFLRDCIDTIADGGGTAIYLGIENGIAQLEAADATTKVILLMTDGQDSYDSEAMDAAEKAADLGIKIHTIGFGDDVDEELLKSIAEETGGEYQYASTENILGITGSFMYAQQSSNAEVLTQAEGTVGEGETSEKTHFTVDDESGNLVVTTAWPGSFLDTILVDPNGRRVDEDYPGAVTDESKIPSTITVTNPIKGEWYVRVKGVETSYEQEPFYTIVAFRKTKTPQINEEMSNLQNLAAYCIPIGLFTTVASILLLCCVGKKKKKDA